MRLLRAAHLMPDPTPPPDRAEAIHEALLSEALGFLRAGGRLTLTEWGELTDLERAALVVAGEQVAAARAAATGLAAQGPVQAATVAAPADGGRALEQMAVDRVVEAAVARMASLVVAEEA